MVLCHTQLRVSEMAEFATELTQFCNEVVEVVNCDEGSLDQSIQKINSVNKHESASTGEGAPFRKSALLVSTPGTFSKLIKPLAKIVGVKYHTAVLDKVDLIQAMDFKDELVDCGNSIME